MLNTFAIIHQKLGMCYNTLTWEKGKKKKTRSPLAFSDLEIGLASGA